MTNKKIKLGMLVAAAALAIFASGCKTTVATMPVFYSNNTHYDFIMLGEVVYESATNTGYQELLAAARSQYPQCDYVIDIMVDSKIATTRSLFTALFPFLFQPRIRTSYTMRGIAIQYTQTMGRQAASRPAQTSAAASTAPAVSAGSAAPAAPASRVDSYGYTVENLSGRASRRDGSGNYVLIREGDFLTEDMVIRVDSGSLVLTKNGASFTIPSGRVGRLADLIARL